MYVCKYTYFHARQFQLDGRCYYWCECANQHFVHFQILLVPLFVPIVFLKVFVLYLQSNCLSIFFSKPNRSTLRETAVSSSRCLKEYQALHNAVMLNIGLTTIYLSIYK